MTSQAAHYGESCAETCLQHQLLPEPKGRCPGALCTCSSFSAFWPYCLLTKSTNFNLRALPGASWAELPLLAVNHTPALAVLQSSAVLGLGDRRVLAPGSHGSAGSPVLCLHDRVLLRAGDLSHCPLHSSASIILNTWFSWKLGRSWDMHSHLLIWWLELPVVRV